MFYILGLDQQRIYTMKSIVFCIIKYYVPNGHCNWDHVNIFTPSSKFIRLSCSLASFPNRQARANRVLKNHILKNNWFSELVLTTLNLSLCIMYCDESHMNCDIYKNRCKTYHHLQDFQFREFKEKNCITKSEPKG